MSKCLVTGGAGFIGSNLVDALLVQGHEVVVLDNLSTGFSANLDSSISLIVDDVRNASAVARALAGCDVVFHLAASVGNVRSIQDPGEDASVNLLGTINVLQSAASLGIRKVIYSSSAATFGEPRSLPMAEDHPQEPDSPYGVSKLAGEKECLAFNKIHSMRNVCLRYFNVYGPRQRFDAYGNVIPIFVQRALAGDDLVIYGSGQQTRDFVHVRDVVAANLAAARPTVMGPYNIGSGTRVTITDLADMVLQASRSVVGVRHEPERAGEVLHSLADLKAAAASLDYRPAVDLQEGLAEYVSWYSKDTLPAD